jgi:citrate lyase beta subunit
MLSEDVYRDLDRRLDEVDGRLQRHYPGEAPGRQPVHTVYVPANRFHADVVADWRDQALEALRTNPPLPFPASMRDRVLAKLQREPIEDLRVDFEDGYGMRDDAREDADARAAAVALRAGPMPPFVGIRCKSLESATRRRAVRTLDVFLDAFGAPPDGFVVTLPKVSAVEQVHAMTVLCGALEEAHGYPAGRVRFEVQVETPPAVLASDGTATVARLIRAADGRLTGLHYGTYDYSAACGIAAGYQSLEHPAADYAKAVMQVAAAGTGVRLSDGSTNVLPVGDTAAVRAAWALHARLVRRSLERGFYQGWDLHPAQLPTRYAATYAFYRDGCAAAAARLAAYLDPGSTGGPGGAGGPGSSGVLDEPATARALAGFLLRGRDCGALDEEEIGLPMAAWESAPMRSVSREAP